MFLVWKTMFWVRRKRNENYTGTNDRSKECFLAIRATDDSYCTILWGSIYSCRIIRPIKKLLRRWDLCVMIWVLSVLVSESYIVNLCSTFSTPTIYKCTLRFLFDRSVFCYPITFGFYLTRWVSVWQSCYPSPTITYISCPTVPLLSVIRNDEGILSSDPSVFQDSPTRRKKTSYAIERIDTNLYTLSAHLNFNAFAYQHVFIFLRSIL